MKTKILAVILAVAMLVSMLPVSAVVSANTYFSSDEFENLDMWEDMAANYRMSTTPSIGTASSVTTYDGKTVLKPAISQGRASGMTTIKAANFPTDKRVETITTKFRLPLENAMTAGQTNPDSSPGVYLLRINNYSGLAFQVTNYYKKTDTTDTNNGTLIYQWIDVYYSEGATQNSKVVDCASKVSRKQTTTTADQWITATFTYDYSQIAENKLTVNAVLTPADGSTSITTSYTKEFEAEGNNAYSEGFQIGIVAAATANIGAYFDSYAVEFEKTVSDEANDFKTKHAYALLELEEINSSGDFDAVEAAIAEYEALDEDVKALLEQEIAKLNSLMNDFDATCFKEDYAQVLELETVANNTQASQVIAAISAYNELDDAVKTLLTTEIATLDALKATIKITEFDFEDEALFNEVFESLPETGDIQTTGSVLTEPTTQNAAAQIVADSKNAENNVLAPEYRNNTRKRKILTLKDEYLKDGNIISFSTDLRVDAQCTNVDRSPGVYFNYVDADNWARMEYQYDTTNEVLKVRLVVGSNASLESGKNEVSQSYPITGVGYGEWVNVKVDYVYTDEGTDLTFTFTGDTDTTVKTLSTDKFNSVKQVGYGAGGNVADLMYFDNFALTYEGAEPEVTPEDLAAEFNTKYEAVLTKDAIGDDDVATVDAAIAEYDTLDEEVQTLLADSITKLNTLKADYLAAREAAEFNSNYGEALDLEAITSDIEYDAVDAALGAYILLDDAVKDIVNLDVAKYQAMMSDYLSAKQAAEDAATYNSTYGEALDLEAITSDIEYDMVVAAITAYNELGDGAKDLLADDTLTKLEALKADYDEYLTADYTPVIKGATIRRSGTQTLAFRCAVGAVNARKQVVDCGIIVTANSYITDGYVNSEDLVVDSTNDLVIVAPLDDVSNITSGYEFTVNIGNISSRNYGVRYIAKVFVKYSDGTIEYSETATKSVISVAKAIATWTFENYEAIDNEYGVGNIAEIITDIDENGKITYAYDVTTDNGVKILEYLEANNEAIAVAYNALKNAQ
ncbi:MAG: hypothetical protein IJP22_04390 [Clostridia bacterium]|nr:hypothetical protein [Clostridia bacterium]